MSAYIESRCGLDAHDEQSRGEPVNIRRGKVRARVKVDIRSMVFAMTPT